MKAKEIALIAIFASIWIAFQVSLGPIVGRFRLGPLSLHGVVNLIVGWFLMLVLAEICRKFGRVSVMAIIAAIGTRSVRVSLVEGLIVGAGYALGGILFDVFFFIPIINNLRGKKRDVYLLVISSITGLISLFPYLLLELSVLSIPAFIAKTPLYAYFALKSVIFSALGATLGLIILPQVKNSAPLD